MHRLAGGPWWAFLVGRSHNNQQHTIMTVVTNGKNKGGAVITAPDIMMPQRLSACQEVSVGHVGPVELERGITHVCLWPHKALFGLRRVEVKDLLHRPSM